MALNVGMLAITITAALAYAPAQLPIPAGELDVAAVESKGKQFARVTFERSQDSAHVFAYDCGDQLAAEIVVWTDAGDGRIDALFPDGSYISVVGDQITVDADDPVAAAEQLALMFAVLSEQDPQASVLPCVGSVALGVGAVVTGNVPGAFGAGVFIGCNCLPLIKEDFSC